MYKYIWITPTSPTQIVSFPTNIKIWNLISANLGFTESAMRLLNTTFLTNIGILCSLSSEYITTRLLSVDIIRNGWNITRILLSRKGHPMHLVKINFNILWCLLILLIVLS